MSSFQKHLKPEIIIKTGSFFIDPLIISTPTNTGGFLLFVAVFNMLSTLRYLTKLASISELEYMTCEFHKLNPD